MSTEVTNYQCPACTAPLRYSGESDSLVCDYCGESYTVADIEALYKGKEEAAAAEAAHQAAVWEQKEEEWGDENGVVSFTCPSCGAELICEETTAATACPYCGNPSVVPGRLHGVLKPDLVLPFRLNKDDAVNALKKHYRKKFLLPRVFRDQNHLEQVKGIYVPFWLYDAESLGDLHFHGTRVSTHREGQYEVTATRHYDIRRVGTVNFTKIPADASSKMPDDYMDSLEPFDFSDLRPFSTAYMPGFLADRYDVSREDCSPRMENRCRQSTKDLLSRDVVGYTTLTPLRQEVLVQKGTIRYALLPVWLLYTDWNGKKFLFAMNGQTGKIVGDLPVDRAKRLLTFLAVTAGLAAVMTLLGLPGHLGAFLYGLFG